MGFIFDNVTTDLTLFLVTSFFLIYGYFMYCYTYWERKKVPFVTPKFPYGNSQSLKGEGVHFGPFVKHYYDLIKEKGLKYGGIYIMNRPFLVLRDPEYIKDILAKDFEYFPNRTVYYNEPNDPISAHLFAIQGAKWRSLRTKLTPTFTSGKMKSFFPTMVKLSSNLTKALNEAADTGSDIDILECSAKFTTDIICNVAFGLESNTFENSKSQFRIMARKIFEAGNIFDKINIMIIGKAPDLARKLGLIGTNKEVSHYFHNLIDDTCKYRKDNNVKRSDFLQLLIDLMESTANMDDPLTWEDVETTFGDPDVITTMEKDQRIRREGGGINQNLSADFVWPEHFGTKTAEIDKRAEATCSEKAATSTSTKKTGSSKHSLISLEKKRLAILTERKRQELEQKQRQVEFELEEKRKETENSLRLLEMEQDLQNAELDEQEELVAQCFLFFVAGYDTSSTTLLFTLYELGKNQDIQDKVREEIEMVLKKYNGETTYEALAELKYMQQVIDESQRLYPPIPNLDRKCVKDYKLRDSNGTVEKGVTVLIPTMSLQRDPDYYPEPLRFDPERFSPENKKLRHPYLHLPFGEGPRNCIGLRFGLMQTKVGLTHILQNFNLSVSPSTKPLELDDYSFFLRPLDTIFLKAKRL